MALVELLLEAPACQDYFSHLSIQLTLLLYASSMQIDKQTSIEFHNIQAAMCARQVSLDIDEFLSQIDSTFSTSFFYLFFGPFYFQIPQNFPFSKFLSRLATELPPRPPRGSHSLKMFIYVLFVSSFLCFSLSLFASYWLD